MNIFEIKSSLANIFAEIEDNDGELTPELEAALKSVEESLNDKVEAYVAIIKNVQNDVNLIDAEMARLKNLKAKRNKLKENLEKILIETVKDLGDTQKNGVKFIDYGTGKVSLRRSQSVDINEDTLNGAIASLDYSMRFLKSTNQLDVVGSLDPNSVISFASNANYSDEDNPDKTIYVTQEDLNNMSAAITVKIPLTDIFNGKAYPIYQKLLDYTDSYKVEPYVNKTELKNVLIENGSAAPNLAKLQNNVSLTIK